ncbi:MAG: hypothetical protein AAF943_00065 [Pseudomonadota bacterium]
MGKHRVFFARAVALLLAAVLLGGAARAEVARPAHGLMWNKTGLPLVFPLRIKTGAGQDYFVVLRDAETDSRALAAYIHGGRFFRVLVPPGTYQVHVAYGAAWRGEEALFGAGTRAVFVDRPLRFAVKGFDRKAGHLLDLTELAPGQEARVAPQALTICQHLVPLLQDGALPPTFDVDARDQRPDTLRFFADPLETLREAADLPVVRLRAEGSEKPRRPAGFTVVDRLC